MVYVENSVASVYIDSETIPEEMVVGRQSAAFPTVVVLDKSNQPIVDKVSHHNTYNILIIIIMYVYLIISCRP